MPNELPIRRFLDWHGYFFRFLTPFVWAAVLLELSIVYLCYRGVASFLIESPIAFALRLLAAAVVATEVLVLLATLVALALGPWLTPTRARWWYIAIVAGLLALAIGIVASTLSGSTTATRAALLLVLTPVLGAALLLGVFASVRGRPVRAPRPLSRVATLATLALAGLGGILPSGIRSLPADLPANERLVRAVSSATTSVLDLPPIVLVTVDTLRASHMSLYGYGVPTTPEIDAWAVDQVVFERALTTKPVTAPALASLLTGLYPRIHGLAKNGQPLARENVTLAEILATRGYRNAAFVANVIVADRKATFDQGFHEWRPFPGDPRAEIVIGEASAWLRAHPDTPFLLWVHVTDPHASYDAPPPFGTRFVGLPNYRHLADLDYETVESYRMASLTHLLGPRSPRLGANVGAYNPSVIGRDWKQLGFDERSPPTPDYVAARYDGEVAYTDSVVGPFLRLVDELVPDALVVFSADHGESLGEHDFFFHHGRNPFEPSARVPLIVSHPSFSPGRTNRLVSLVDVFPTVLALLGFETDQRIDGVSFSGALFAGSNRDGRSPDRSVRIEAMSLRGYPTLALRTERWKLILTPKRIFLGLDALLEAQLEWVFGRRAGLFARSYHVELYDLDEDPEELVDASSEHLQARASLETQLWQMLESDDRRLAAAGPIRQVDELDDATRAQLEALGYAHDR